MTDSEAYVKPERAFLDSEADVNRAERMIFHMLIQAVVLGMVIGINLAVAIVVLFYA